MEGQINDAGIAAGDSPYYFQLYIFEGVGITGSYGKGVHQESGSFGNLPPTNVLTRNRQTITWTGLRDGKYYMDVYNRNLSDTERLLVRTEGVTVGTAE